MPWPLALRRYEKMESRVSIPTLLITSLSGLLSFMGGTPLFSQEQKTYIAVITGVLATVVRGVVRLPPVVAECASC
jgi:hypothetical protein